MDHLSGELRTLIELARRGGFSPAAKARIWRRIELGLERQTCAPAPSARWNFGARWLVVCAAAAVCLVAPRWLGQEPARSAQRTIVPALALNEMEAPVISAPAAAHHASETRRRVALRKPANPQVKTSPLLQQVAEELALSARSEPSVEETATGALEPLAEVGELGSPPSKRVEQPLARRATTEIRKPSLLETLRRDALERRRAAIGERALLASARRSLPSIGGYSD